MPYFTLPAKGKVKQITFDDFLRGTISTILEEKNTKDTCTYYKTNTPEVFKKAVDVPSLIRLLKQFTEKHKPLIETQNKRKLYHSFHIPKRKGGFRKIDQPLPALMEALRELKLLIEGFPFAKYHTSAFAYVKGRCPKDAVERHQKHKSRWFLKLDFHNFFGSVTLDFTLSQLEKIYPYCEIIANQDGKKYLTECLSLCFLDGGLPQGTPISPFLTNLIMIPIDYSISKYARENENQLCYTRYADDFQITAKKWFNHNNVIENIVEILRKFNAPLSLNNEKTIYGSYTGRNWILGVMLNKENKITIGQQKKHRLKNVLFSFINDYKAGNTWALKRVQKLNGEIAYYLSVEKETISNIIETYSKKYNFDIFGMIKSILKEGI